MKKHAVLMLAAASLMMATSFAQTVKPTDDATNKPTDQISLADEFTAIEKANIHVKTAGLFDEDDQFTIDFSKLKRSEWCYPLRNGKLISPYGGNRRHAGIDIKTHAGDTVYAAFSGRVRFSNANGAYGNVIVLRHTTGMETLYSHNKRNLVRIGDMVKAGQPIAIVGRTGRATTEHVHFETRINGKHYNPTQFFDTTTRTLKCQRVIAYKSGKIETYNVVPANNIAEGIVFHPTIADYTNF